MNLYTAIRIHKEVLENHGGTYASDGENLKDARKWAVVTNSTYTRRTKDLRATFLSLVFWSLEKEGQRVVGLWWNPVTEVWEIEAVTLIDSYEEAVQRGKANNQIGIYYLDSTKDGYVALNSKETP